MQNSNRKYSPNTDSAIVRPAVILALLISVLLILTLVFFIIVKVSGTVSQNHDENDTPTEELGEENENGDGAAVHNSPFYTSISDFYPSYVAEESLKNLSNAGLNSPNIALVDVAANKIIASSKSGKSNVIYPASLTKVMTLIVAFENLKNEDQLKEKITLDAAIVDKMVEEGSSGYGFKAGEVLTVEELLHAVILYSDGTACLALANYISGSEANFVKLMNDKATEMGLQNTLFQNSTGLHHKYHYSTCQDIAAIMMYAMKNPHCARIMTAQSFTFGSHFRPNSEGNTYIMYNQALHNSKFTQPNKITVTAAKTGYTGSTENDESGYCFVSYGKTRDGKAFILVTAGAATVALRNQDTVTIYDTYAK